MTAFTPAVNPIKAWLSEFLLTRELFKGPNGKPLYSYQLSEHEYASLRDLLQKYLRLASSPVQVIHLGACFCLFVSEQYRRNYNSSWSWSGAESELAVSLSHSQHATLTSKGLEYWKRPIRYRENGRDWLGSLFAEGGLPWPLVQKESHGFGKAVNRGINLFSAGSSHRTTADLIAAHEDELPISFRNLETRQLLAGIVEQLMHLAGQYPLKDQKDPAAYLDKVAPEWTEAFPIPLDETNARGLINDWLHDAGKQRLDRKEGLIQARAFTCEHFLLGTLPDWRIRTELALPKEHSFDIDAQQLGSTRLDQAYYEGEHILARGPAVYAQLNESCLTIRFSNPSISIERRRLGEPVTLRLLDNGRVVQCYQFDGSELDYEETPLVFEQRADCWQLVGTSSCGVAGESARIRIPTKFSFSSDGLAPSLLTTDKENGQWLNLRADVSLQNGPDLYRIELNQNQNEHRKPALAGVQGLYDSNPGVVYLGWPRLELPEDYEFGLGDTLEFANGQPLDTLRRTGPFGVVRYTLKNRTGKTLLTRRFAVLPKEFSTSLLPATTEKPARLQIKGALQLDLKIDSSLLMAKRLESDHSATTFSLIHRTDTPPAGFTLEIDQKNSNQPLRLHLPYPYQGARLIGPDDRPSQAHELTLPELIGHRIALTSGQTQGQSFYMQLELVCEALPHPKRHYEIKVGSSPTLLNLFSYQNDMLQMLGAVDEQDAFIRLTLETEKRALSLNIRRYNGRLQWESRDTFTICEISNATILNDTEVEAMLLSDPKQAPVKIEELKSQNVGTGRFILPNTMQRDGPWLIYPAKDSKTQFRPALFVSASSITEIQTEVFSLHRATQVFHPKTNPNAISQQITVMAKEFGHSGWQYLADLKQHYAHLPLSSFESWKALSKQPDALAFAVLRLEMDEVFCARIRDELAVIWEAIPLPIWFEAHARFLQGLIACGLPEILIKNLETNRAAVLRLVVSGFDYLGDYLSTGNKSSLTKIPPQLVVPGWNQALRQQHATDRQWPTDLTAELTSWFLQNPIPEFLREITPVGFTKAVSYLPIFLAYVTAGKATLNDLPVPMAYLKFAIRLVSDFDRQGWFAPTHALMVSYLLASEDEA